MDRKRHSGTEITGNLRIRPSLKQEIKITAIRRGVYEYELAEEMWKLWQEYHGEGKSRTEPGTLTAGHRTQEEEELCQAVMDFWRDPVARDEDPGGIGAAVLDSFVKRFLRKRAAGGEP